jgi:hypothetical protein
VSQDARTRPIAHRTAFEAQIPTEVLRQNPSRSPVHHEGRAREAALPIPRRVVDRPQDSRRQSPDCRSATTALESAPRGEREVLTAAGYGLSVASNVPSPKYAALVAPCRPWAADFRFRPQTDSTAARAGGKLGNFGGFATPSVTQRNIQEPMHAISMR